MLGKWIDQQSDEALDRILTRPMRPGGGHRGTVCLVATARDQQDDTRLAGSLDIFPCPPDSYRYNPRVIQENGKMRFLHRVSVPAQYDDLCYRFGTERIGALIRNRALRVLASRQPQPVVRRYPMTTVFAGMAVDAARTTWGTK